MKILVTGVTGQLGRETVLALKRRGVDAQGISRAEVDFSQPTDVETFFATQTADWVINCAAYTQVDQAESDARVAFLVNRDSAAAVARESGSPRRNLPSGEARLWRSLRPLVWAGIQRDSSL